MAIAYCLAKELARIIGVDVMDIAWDDPELDFMAIILGDDNVTCLNNSFREFVDSGRFEQSLLQLGFKSKLVVRDDIYATEFCS